MGVALAGGRPTGLARWLRSTLLATGDGHNGCVSSAEYQRQWRASKGARTGQPGRPATQPCGTVAAYRRHLRNGETPDEACRQANAQHHRELYARRKAKP